MGIYKSGQYSFNRYYDMLTARISAAVHLKGAIEPNKNSPKYSAIQSLSHWKRGQKTMLDLLQDNQTQRMIFDHRQALQFMDAPSVDAEWARRIQLPFDHLYIEFTEPLMLGLDAENPHDELQAFCVYKTYKNTAVNEWDWNVSAYQVFYFISNPNGEQSDGAFTWHKNGGYASTSIRTSVQNRYDPSILACAYPKDMYEEWVIPSGPVTDFNQGVAAISDPTSRYNDVAQSQVLPTTPSNKYDTASQIFFKVGTHAGYKGVWERQISTYTHLLNWMFAYMMSKGLKIQIEHMPRAVKRRAEREGYIPKPWHIITVDPRLSDDVANPDGIGTGRKHSYRYDVMGHLRFGRHKLSDGTYKVGPEWIRAHQRGQRHNLYIPATRKYKQGKIDHPKMEEWWNKGRGNSPK